MIKRQTPCIFNSERHMWKIIQAIDIEEGVTVDLDEKRHIVGIEILDASKKLSLKDIVNITIENLPVETAAA
jgi:uncharacterized protein YuzE